MNNFYETKDKKIAPYLLTCSDILFQGTRFVGDSIYFLFSPNNIAQERANKFITHQTEPVDPKMLLEAVETYRDIVFEMKDKRGDNELQKS